jgi:hypothetical protein
MHAMAIRVEYRPIYPRKFDSVYVVEYICVSKTKLVIIEEYCVLGCDTV